MTNDYQNLEFSVFDTETSGLSPKDGARLLEIGIVRIDIHGNELARYSSLINPGDDVDLGPTEIHGITRDDLTGAPTFSEILGDIILAVEGSLLSTHNAPFDTKFLQNEFALAGHIWPEQRVLDTLTASRKLMPSLVNHKLATVAAALDVTFDGPAHSALADAVVTAQVHAKLLAMAPNVAWPAPTVWPSIDPSGKSHSRFSHA